MIRNSRLRDASNPNDVLVNGVWTGPGTANPQAGEIAGANPGLAQLAQYLGMSPAQAQTWINNNTANAAVAAASPGAAPPATAATLPAGGLMAGIESVPTWLWVGAGIWAVLLMSSK